MIKQQVYAERTRWENRCIVALDVLMFVIGFGCFAQQAAATAQFPNILIIVADDLGWNDVGFHNSEMRTPSLDRLAQRGVEFDCHYVQPECTPTRVALLTGRYPSRFGSQAMNASNQRAIPYGTPTLASMMKTLGYATGMAGKWHLGSKPEWGPNHYGFDSSYGSLAGAVGVYDHRYRLNTPFSVTWHRDEQIINGFENGTHTTDLIAQEAVRWIRQHNGERWFFYVPFHAVHTPLVEKDPRWSDMNQHLRSTDRRLYAAAVSHMDSAIGQMLQALKSQGQLEETLVLFFSDNGAQVYHRGGVYPPPDPKLSKFSSNAPFRGSKAQLYEGGYRVPAMIHWPKELEARKVEEPVHVVDWMPTFASLLGQQFSERPEWDGRNIWPLITGELETVGERTFYFTWRHDRKWEALRQGDWKIVRRKDEEWELYNLQQDPYEEVDLAKKHPQITDKLIKVFEQERAKDPD